MNQAVAFPFLTLSPESVTHNPCLISINGAGPVLLGDAIPDWDYATTIILNRRIEIDFDRAEIDLNTPKDQLRLAVVFELGTGANRLPSQIITSSVEAASEKRSVVDFDVEAPSHLLCSQLFIKTSIVLYAPPAEAGSLVPESTGSRLWWDEQCVRLENEDPRFPIEMISFRKQLGNTSESRSLWYLDWSPLDWSSDFRNAVRLYLNNDNPALVEKIHSADPILLQTISADVIGQILSRLVQEGDAEDILEYAPPNSLAAQAAWWISLGWPDSSAESIRELLHNAPGRFYSVVYTIAEITSRGDD